MKLSEEYLNEMNKLLGGEYSSYLESTKERSHRALRVNTLKLNSNEFIKINPWGIKKEDAVLWCEDAFYFDTGEPIGKSFYHQAGAFYIQEPSAMLPAAMLGAKKNERVLDLCAAPGGKSTQLAAAMENTGLLIANEINYDRAKILSENIERMGIANALVISASPDALAESFNEYFDRILVDAPCSGEGMFRKNPEAVNEWSLENVNMCAQRQQDILRKAYTMLKKGGSLVYSTCTFNRKENEDNIDSFLTEHDDMSLIKNERLMPHKIKGEGHFCALLKKSGGTENAQTGGEIKKTESDYTLPKGDYLTKKSVRHKDTEQSKEIKEYSEFKREYLNVEENSVFKDGIIKRYEDTLLLMPKDLAELNKLKGIRVLRSGLCLGTLKKDRFVPSHSLALFLKENEFTNVVRLNEECAERYLRGEAVGISDILNKEKIKDGWALITADNLSIGFGKINNGMIKNHYPKGLRVY